MRVCWQQREKKNADAADVLFSIFFSLEFFWSQIQKTKDDTVHFS